MLLNFVLYKLYDIYMENDLIFVILKMSKAIFKPSTAELIVSICHSFNPLTAGAAYILFSFFY